MQNGRFINIVTKLQNQSRWAEHFPHFKDNAASHSYRVGVYSLLTGLIAQKVYKEEVDMEQVVCGAIYHDINETQIGPMKHRTKKEEAVEALISQLEFQENIKIVGYLSESLKPKFRNYIVEAENTDTIEGNIVDAMDTFDAMMFCHREVKNGSNAEFFQKTFQKLAEYLRGHDLQSVRYMMEAFDERSSFYNFMYEVMMLDQVERWRGRFNTIADSDSDHSYRAAAIGIFFGVLENIKYGVEVDVFRLVAKILCHDIPEIRTGDVIGPVKHSTPEMKKAFEEYENQVAQEMVQQLPTELHEDFYDFMVDAKSSDYIGEMVAICDKVDALIKTNMERRINYREYELSYRKQLKSIQKKYTNPCVMFFLAYILHDMDYPMFDEI